MANTAIEAQGLEELPVDAIKLLIDMIRGATPFNALAAIKAALELANWAVDLFGGSDASSVSIASCDQKDHAIAVGLQSLLPVEEGGVSAQALPFPREVLIEMLLKWIFDWLNRRLNG